jgi:hypothetical protein
MALFPTIPRRTEGSLEQRRSSSKDVTMFVHMLGTALVHGVAHLVHQGLALAGPVGGSLKAVAGPLLVRMAPGTRFLLGAACALLGAFWAVRVLPRGTARPAAWSVRVLDVVAVGAISVYCLVAWCRDRRG